MKRGCLSNSPKRYRLPNGLRVIEFERPGQRIASAFLFLRIGSRYERAGSFGLSHFTEHALFKGTLNYPNPQSLARAADCIAADLNATTHAEYTEFYGSASGRHFYEMLELLAEITLKPAFPPHEVEKEKGIVLDEIRQSCDSSGTVVNLDELLLQLLWGEAYLQFVPTGTAATVILFDSRRLLRFHRRHFTPDNAVLCCVGGFESAELRRALRKLFGPWQGTGRPSLRPLRLNDAETEPCFRRFNAALAGAKMAFPSCSYFDTRQLIVSLLAELIGGGATSRLFLKLREEHALVYDVGSSASFFTDVGWLDIFASAEPGDLPRVLELIDEEIRSIVEHGASEEEISGVKERLITTLEMIEDKPDELAEWYGVRELLRAPRRLLSPTEGIGRVEGLTGSQILKVAREFFVPSSRRLAIVGPLRKSQLRRAGRALSS